MAPNIIGCYKIENFIVEISSGKFIDQNFFDVTVANKATQKHLHDKCFALDSIKGVQKYLDKLENE